MTKNSSVISSLGKEKYLLLTTFRKTGVGVPTPIWIAQLDDNTLCFTTTSTTGKVKRMRHTAEVTVQPCNSRGEVISGSEITRMRSDMVTVGTSYEGVLSAVAAKYGWQFSAMKAVMRAGNLVRKRKQPFVDTGVRLRLLEGA